MVAQSLWKYLNNNLCFLRPTPWAGTDTQYSLAAWESDILDRSLT